MQSSQTAKEHITLGYSNVKGKLILSPTLQSRLVLLYMVIFRVGGLCPLSTCFLYGLSIFIFRFYNLSFQRTHFERQINF